MSSILNSTSLAGLDAMIFHINNQSTASGGSPRRFLHKSTMAGGMNRKVFADRTSDLNFKQRTPSTKSSISFRRDRSREKRPRSSSQSKSFRSRSSFKPLPRVPSTSTLQISSFLEYPFHSFTLSLDASPQLSSTPHSLSSEPHRTSRSVVSPEKSIHDEPFHIPALQHPNSPYVPWAPRVRHQVFGHLSPASYMSRTSYYSRPYSRSGARAPEPDVTIDLPTRNRDRLLKFSQKLKRAMKINIFNVARKVSKFKVRKRHTPDPEPWPPSNPHLDHAHVSSFGGTVDTANYSLSSPTPLEILSRCAYDSSTTSLHSSDSAALDSWLASRQQASRDCEPERMMSLDEYERMGSWLDLSRTNGTLCGVPGCDMHTQISTKVFPARPTSLTSSPIPEPQYMDRVKAPVPPRATSSLASRSAWFDTPPGWSDGDQSVHSLKTFGRRGMSMPGGWAFLS